MAVFFAKNSYYCAKIFSRLAFAFLRPAKIFVLASLRSVGYSTTVKILWSLGMIFSYPADRIYSFTEISATPPPPPPQTSRYRTTHRYHNQPSEHNLKRIQELENHKTYKTRKFRKFLRSFLNIRVIALFCSSLKMRI